MISDIKLVRHILEYNGFKEIFGNRNTSWCLFWGNNNFKSDVYEVMNKYQKCNHFPKTSEITHKDLMYNRMAGMISKHGQKHYGYTPMTFVLPNETS